MICYVRTGYARQYDWQRLPFFDGPLCLIVFDDYLHELRLRVCVMLKAEFEEKNFEPRFFLDYIHCWLQHLLCTYLCVTGFHMRTFVRV